MRSSNSASAMPPHDMLLLAMLAVVLPLAVLVAVLSVGFSPSPVFLFGLFVVAPLIALRMTLRDQTD